MELNLNFDPSGGLKSLVDFFNNIMARVADLRASIDPDIRRRGDLMVLQSQEDLYYLARNGLIQLGIPLPKVDQPAPLVLQAKLDTSTHPPMVTVTATPIASKATP